MDCETVSNFSSIDTLILLLYFAATMAIGFLCMRSGGRSVEGFTAADRSLPGWLTGLSILGSFVSSISFLALPGKSYATNWNPFVHSIALPIATLISVYFFLPLYRRIGSVSAYEHLEKRFGPWARVYSGTCYLLTQLARMGAVTYLMALPMSVLLGWDIYTVILITGISVTLYTLVGGIVAVIWTEAIQTVVLIAGAIACAVIITLSIPGGFGALISESLSAGKFSLGSWDVSFESLSQNTVLVIMLYGLFIHMQNFGIDQNYVQRYITAKSDAEARKGLWIGGIVYLPLSAIFFYIGTALFCYYKAYPELLPAAYADKPDYVFPYYMVTELPVGFRGLLVASVFAAAMSTISCSLNSSSTILLTDYYKRYFAPSASKASEMAFLRISTVVWGIMGTAMALFFTNSKSALDVFWLLAGIFGGGMLGLFLLGIMGRRVGNIAAAAGVAVGIAVIIWMTFPSYVSQIIPWIPESPFNMFLIPAFSTCSIFVSGFALGEVLHALKRKRA